MNNLYFLKHKEDAYRKVSRAEYTKMYRHCTNGKGEPGDFSSDYYFGRVFRDKQEVSKQIEENLIDALTVVDNAEVLRMQRGDARTYFSHAGTLLRDTISLFEAVVEG